MAGKLDVYNLGALGVNLVDGPIHMKDGELLQCQNAIASPIGAQVALVKRPGMDKINAVAAAGTILSINNIPISSFGDTPVCSILPSLPDGAWSTGAWSPTLGLFAVVEGLTGAGRIITSPDGSTWTLRTAPADVSWRDVIWAASLSLFVAVGGADLTETSQVMTSPNGVTWTLRSATSDRTWHGVAWSPTLVRFVAVASDGVAAGMVMTSPDAITWTAQTAAAAQAWRRVVWADTLSLFVAVSETTGTTSQVMTSPDGITWTLRNTLIASAWNDITWSSSLGRLVAVGAPYVGGGGSVYAMYSSDGINWTASTQHPGSSTSLAEVEWGEEVGLFFNAAGTTVNYISTDGITWQAVPLGCGQDSSPAVAYSSTLEKFIAIGESSLGDPVIELLGVP